MRKLLVVFSLSLLALPVMALAATDDAVDYTGLNTTAQQAFTVNDASGDIRVFIGAYIIQPILGIIGLAFLLMMIYAGMLWMTARGNPDQVKKAKEILQSAIIGVVIVVAAYAITTAVFNALTTGNVGGDSVTAPAE